MIQRYFNLKTLQRATLVGIASLLISTNATATVLAADVDFYSGNAIEFYSDNAVACSTNPSPNTMPDAITGSDVAEKVFNFLTNTTFKGLDNTAMNAVQAAGVLGNFQRESGMVPSKVQNGGGGGRGLAQWDDRAKFLYAFADKQGKPWQDLDVQLGYLKKELDEWEGTNLVDKGFLTVSTPEQAAVVFEDAFERSGVKALDERKAYAVEYYGRFASTVTDGKSFESFIGGCRYSGSGSVGDYMDDAKFTSYAQCAASTGGGKWGTMTNYHGQDMCLVGCGPTSLAMVIKNMTGQDVTPEDTLAHYNEHRLWTSYGSGPAAMRQAANTWGLKTEDFDPRNLDNYKQVFEKGGLVVIGGVGPEPFYTAFGHYVVVRGITEDGKLHISDPGRGVVKDYDAQQVMASTSNRVDNATAFYTK